MSTEVRQAALNTAVPFIAEFEGLRLKAYRDPVGIWTIGYGHTQGVRPGDVWTREQAEEALRSEVAKFMTGVEELVDVPLTLNQLAALTSFSYNVGLGALRRSSLLKRLNEENYAAAANQFLRWNRAGGRVLNGLTRRRRAEKELFLREG